MALVPAVVDAVAPLPVVAAGGIADGRGLAAALMLGASAACAARPSTPVMNRWRMTKGPWSLRTLRNASTERWAGDLIGLRRTLPEQQKALEHARRHADFDIAPVIAGEATDLVRERRSADAIVADLVQQAAQCLAQPPSAIL